VIFECRDHRALSAFWSDVLDLAVRKDLDGWVELAPGRAGVVMGFQPVDPTAPPSHVRSPISIDIEVEDLDVAQAHFEAAGAKLVRVVHFTPEEEHRVMADPEGNEFNLVLPFPAGW
jgi:predicted enzyme related to lactoylglutathione lyase